MCKAHSTEIEVAAATPTPIALFLFNLFLFFLRALDLNVTSENDYERNHGKEINK